MQQLLVQSAEMDGDFRALLASAPVDHSTRAVVAASMCSLAFDHGHSLRMLLQASVPSSSLALFRCQFEVVARAVWIAFAAKEEWLIAFTSPVEGLDEPVRSPSMDEMLRAISVHAPRKASDELSLLKAGVWKALHSYVHGGVRPIAESITGYQPAFLKSTVLNSNGLTAMAAMVLAGLAPDRKLLHQVLAIQFAHLECLPSRQPVPKTGVRVHF